MEKINVLPVINAGIKALSRLIISQDIAAIVLIGGQGSNGRVGFGKGDSLWMLLFVTSDWLFAVVSGAGHWFVRHNGVPGSSG